MSQQWIVLAQASLESDRTTPTRVVKVVRHEDSQLNYLRIEVDASIVGLDGQQLTNESTVDDYDLVMILTGKKRGFHDAVWSFTTHGEIELLKNLGLDKKADGKLERSLVTLELPKRLITPYAQIANLKNVSVNSIVEEALANALPGIQNPKNSITIHLDRETFYQCGVLSDNLGTTLETCLVKLIQSGAPAALSAIENAEFEEE